jgi:hypothetical protein
MSQDLVNLTIRPLDEQLTPFSDPIVGTGNTVLMKTTVSGETLLIGIGSTENGELGAINPNLANETALSLNNGVGFTPYEPNVSIIAGGEDFFGFIYVNDGVVVEDEIYTWGLNDKYQLGRGGKDMSNSGENVIEKQAGPGRIDISGVSFAGTNRIRTYQAGWNHAHVTTADNRVFSWGNNLYGQLGIEDGVSGSLVDPSNHGIEPQEITLSLDGEDPYAVYGGQNFSTVLTLSGNVYAYGINDTHQLGISDGGTTDLCETPVKIDISDVVHISTGKSFVTALRSNGTVWGWGDDTYGQISLSSGTVVGRYVDVPTQITDIDDAVYVSAGNNHVCILRSNGQLRIVGDNQYQQSDEPLINKNLLLGYAIANNIFYVEMDGDVFAHGAGVNNSSGLIGNTQDTTGPDAPVSFLNTEPGNPPININITTIYNPVLQLEYNLITEITAPVVLKYDEDQTLPSSDYMQQQQAICLIREIARNTDSTVSSLDACCNATPGTKTRVNFKSFKEQLQYEKGLFILDKQCLIKN